MNQRQDSSTAEHPSSQDREVGGPNPPPGSSRKLVVLDEKYTFGCSCPRCGAVYRCGWRGGRRGRRLFGLELGHGAFCNLCGAVWRETPPDWWTREPLGPSTAEIRRHIEKQLAAGRKWGGR